MISGAEMGSGCLQRGLMLTIAGKFFPSWRITTVQGLTAENFFLATVRPEVKPIPIAAFCLI
ncbi:hypothetical protein AWM79_05950 [Pseudomonas agarici]|uniref:Uncharacterized protein n=1 Tax=Pseudomonas agarici TaxID=46677 RepID=A0A0X1SYH4_PSEAA|nr:hypothetical protein AWM79_05950 [Pseudomonas agarici]